MSRPNKFKSEKSRKLCMRKRTGEKTVLIVGSSGAWDRDKSKVKKQVGFLKKLIQKSRRF